MKIHTPKRYYALRVILDSITVMGAWWLTFLIRFVLLEGSSGQMMNFAFYSPLIVIVYIYNMDVHKLMDREVIEDWADEFSSIVKVCLKSFFAIIIFFYFINYSIFSRLSLFIFFLLSLLFLTVERIIIDDSIARRRKKGKQFKKVFFVGDDPKLREYGEMLQKYPEKGMKPLFWFDSAGMTLNGVNPCEGDLIEQIKKANVDMVVIGYNLADSEHLNKILIRCYDLLIPVVILADLPYTFLNNQMEKDKNFNVFHYNSFSMTFTDRVFKRSIDILGAIVGLLIFSPLYLFFPLIIKISSPGPVFYGQKRMTRDGKEFQMWKFRSMPVDVENKSGAVWASKSDNRATKFGKFMRSTSLDEIPQFWNVFLGQMSLVGPRPERPELIEKFQKEIPGYMLRHKMKAGITGWAQVNGFRGNTSLERRIEFDHYYINHWSLLMDIKIIFLTLIRGFLNENAY